MAAKKEKTFEEALDELEKIVGDLESGEPTLQDLLKKYSCGIELADKCQKDLDRAVRTVDALVSADGSLKAADLSELRG